MFFSNYYYYYYYYKYSYFDVDWNDENTLQGA